MTRMPPSAAFAETLVAYGLADRVGMSALGVQTGTVGRTEALDKAGDATMKPHRLMKTYARSNAA